MGGDSFAASDDAQYRENNPKPYIYNTNPSMYVYIINKGGGSGNEALQKKLRHKAAAQLFVAV